MVFFLLKHISSSVFSTSQYRFIHNGLLSDDYFSSIKTYATQFLDQQCDAHYIIAQLKKEFPVVDKIEIAYRPCGTYVMVRSHKPLCCINEDQILTDHHQLVTKDYFSSPVLDSLNRFTVAENCLSHVASLVPSLLAELPSDFKQAYDLELRNEHHMCLRSKQEKNFSIVASALQKKLSCVLAQCELVKKKLVERKDFNEKINWVADARFADYIIAYKT